MGDDFYADGDAAAEAARTRGSFNVIDTRSFLKIDVFIPSDGPLGAGQLTRRQRLDVLPNAPPLPVLAAEDIVLQKLRWYQLGGETSDRQWRDLVSVLRQNRSRMDVDYLREVAVGRLEALLDRAMAETA